MIKLYLIPHIQGIPLWPARDGSGTYLPVPGTVESSHRSRKERLQALVLNVVILELQSVALDIDGSTAFTAGLILQANSTFRKLQLNFSVRNSEENSIHVEN